MPALFLSPGQRAELRAAAHALKPVVLIGAEGLTDAVRDEIGVHLAAHQLIKIRVFGDERAARIALYEQICDQLDAAPIQHIGKLLVIWKPLDDAPKSKPASKTLRAPGTATLWRDSAVPGARAVRSSARKSFAAPAASTGLAGRAARPVRSAYPSPSASDGPVAARRGAAPRIVKVVKPSDNPMRRPKPQNVLVRGNERVTAGGNVKRAKKRQTSAKRPHQRAK